MKIIFVLLLVIGIACAVPLKTPSKNLQDLLTQKNLNSLLQQNQDLYQSLIATYQSQYQLVSEWLASYGFVLPRFGNIQSHLRNSDFESILEQFGEDYVEIMQQFLQPVLLDIFVFAYSNPAQWESIFSTLESFMGSFQDVDEFTDDTSILQLFIQIALSAFKYIFTHQTEVQQVTDFFNNLFSVDEFIISLTNAFLSNFGPFINEQLNSLSHQEILQQFLQAFNFQQLLTPDIVSEILMYCITNLDDAAIPISFLTSLGINYFNVAGQLFAGTFDPEQFMTPEIAAAAYQWIVAHPNDVVDLANFFFDFFGYSQINPITSTTPIIGPMINTLSNNFPNLVPSVLLDIFG